MNENKPKITVTVKNLDRAAWLDFKAKAVRKGITIQDAVQEAIDHWRKLE